MILEIDGSSTAGLELSQAVKKMKGPPGTKVTLLIRHADEEEETVKLTITRELIRTKSVLGDTQGKDGHWIYFLEQEPRIGYVRITTFGEHSVEELRQVLPFREHPIDALILDLRGNVGGLLNAAVDTCDMFIDQGLIVSTRGREGGNREVHEANPSDTLFDKSILLVLLVDRYSASASEIVAACLKDHDRAVVVGERTWGKGTVQNVIPLERGTSALKLTTASYWRPNGKNIHRRRKATEEDDWGVRPTNGLEVKLTDKQYRQLYEQRRKRDVFKDGPTSNEEPPETTEDPQLKKALDYLNKKLARTAA